MSARDPPNLRQNPPIWVFHLSITILSDGKGIKVLFQQILKFHFSGTQHNPQLWKIRQLDKKTEWSSSSRSISPKSHDEINQINTQLNKNCVTWRSSAHMRLNKLTTLVMSKDHWLLVKYCRLPTERHRRICIRHNLSHELPSSTSTDIIEHLL